MATVASAAETGEESLIILQSLLCLLREKNLLSRADIEELCHKVEARTGPLSCCDQTASAARDDMARLRSYIGKQYGGKHLRV